MSVKSQGRSIVSLVLSGQHQSAHAHPSDRLRVAAVHSEAGPTLSHEAVSSFSQDQDTSFEYSVDGAEAKTDSPNLCCC